MNGIALLVVAAWNIITSVVDLSSGTPESAGSIRWAVLGALQVYWAFQSFAKRRECFDSVPITMSEESVRRVDDLLKAIDKSNPSKDPSVVQFHQKNFLTDRVWKGQLFAGGGVFVTPKGPEGVAVRPHDVHLEVRGKVRVGKTAKATVKLGPLNMYVLIPPESLERLQAWKDAPGAPVPA